MMDKITTDTVSFCIPIVAENEVTLARSLDSALEQNPDFIEFRRDYYDGNEESAFSLLKKAKEECGILYTYRSSAEGGNKVVGDSIRFAGLLRAIEAGVCDYVDIEAAAASQCPDVLHAARERGVGIILSRHDFMWMPSLEEMERTLVPQGDCIVKAAYTCRSTADLIRLVEAGEAFSKRYPTTPLILIGMGERGVLTRVLPELVHSNLTFCADREQSAPGQLTIHEVLERRRLLGYA